MRAGYTSFHPRWYRARMPIFWWLRKPAYIKFITRELTSVAVAYAALLLLLQAWMLLRGPATAGRLQAWLQHPMVLAFHALIVLALLFHTVSWLNLAPKALVLHVRGRRLPDAAVAAAHYAGWLGASALVAWLLLGG